jgi:hypothetical protein
MSEPGDSSEKQGSGDSIGRIRITSLETGEVVYEGPVKPGGAVDGWISRGYFELDEEEERETKPWPRFRDTGYGTQKLDQD